MDAEMFSTPVYYVTLSGLNASRTQRMPFSLIATTSKRMM